MFNIFKLKNKNHFGPKNSENNISKNIESESNLRH